MQVQFSNEILDHIFSFLSDRETLIACSKDPVLSSIVERHFYYHVVVHIGKGPTDHAFEQNQLSNLVSANPRILCHVRILQIRAKFGFFPSQEDRAVLNLLDSFANTLVMFPALKCIMLTPVDKPFWHWSTPFRVALEDRLQLPTIKELHLTGSHDFPLSLLDNCKNIKNLSLSGLFDTTGPCDVSVLPSVLPQLKSLTFGGLISSSILTWVRRHINELESLKFVFSWNNCLELLEACPGSLNKLEFDFIRSQYSTSNPRNGYDCRIPGLSSPPPKLRQLLIRTAVCKKDGPQHLVSWLPAAAKTIKLFIASPRRLILDIRLDLPSSDLTKVDFSPLTVLEAASASIPHIDLYIRTRLVASAPTREHLLSLLEGNEGISRSIKKGALVIHWRCAVKRSLSDSEQTHSDHDNDN